MVIVVVVASARYSVSVHLRYVRFIRKYDALEKKSELSSFWCITVYLHQNCPYPKFTNGNLILSATPAERLKTRCTSHDAMFLSREEFDLISKSQHVINNLYSTFI